MYRISEFSKITQLTIKALRYYDEEKLLSPSYRHEVTQYRYYSQADFERAQLIKLLRELDFSIAEIRDLLNHLEQPSDLSYYLEEKKQMLEEKIAREKRLLQRINSQIRPLVREAEEQVYTIFRETVPPVLVASIRYQGRYDQMGTYVGQLYRAAGGKQAGPLFSCYQNEAYQEVADIEICLPLKGKISCRQVTVKWLPELTALITCHKGPYQSLHLAYKALLDDARSQGLLCLVPYRERYVKGPGLIFKGNPERYQTELMIPYQEEKNHG